MYIEIIHDDLVQVPLLFQGPKGEKGEPGQDGAPGVPGPAGAAGALGAKGDKGNQGAQGNQGPAGTTGATGATGAPGAKGDKGDTGAGGATGATGSTGAQGAKGEKGDQGVQGPQGNQGPAGTTGATGAPGAKGDKGDTGAVGVTGATGSTGAQGVKGEKGDQGIQGPQGNQGATGATGATGAKGEKGDQGIQGIAGAVGPIGSTGEKGQKGDKGEPGIVTQDLTILAQNVFDNTNKVGQDKSDVIKYASQVAIDSNQVNADKNIVQASALQVSANRNFVEAARDQTELIKNQAIEIVSSQSIYLGIWDAENNIPLLTASVPAKGSWYEVGKPGAQNINGSNFLYKEGQKVISNGLIWELSTGGLVPGNKTVSLEKLSPVLQNLVGQLPDYSEVMFAIVDVSNKKAFAINNDGTITGKFHIDATHLQPSSVGSTALAPSSVTTEKLAATVRDHLITDFANDSSEYVFLILDAQNRIGFGIKKDGSVTGNFVLKDYSVVSSKLAPASISTASLQNLSVTVDKLSDGSVNTAKLHQTVKESLIRSTVSTTPEYLFSILDANNRVAFGIKEDGSLVGKFALTDGSITEAKLSSEISANLVKSFNNDNSDYLFLIHDALNKIGFGIKKDGSIVGKFPGGADGSITLSKLAPEVTTKLPTVPFNRLNSYNSKDVDCEDDGMWRSVEIDIPVRTDSIGSLFLSFPPAATKVLKGLNDTGTALLFRKTNSLTVRGRRHRGTFNPIASGIIGTNLRGNYGNSNINTYPAFPAGSTGDCWIIDCGNTSATKTANGLTFKNGDVLVKTSSGYDIQPGPGDGITLNFDFWNISASGVFAGMSLTAGDRIVMVTKMAQGGPNYNRYTGSRKGEYFYMGEADPATFSPVSPLNGDFYNFSVAGTTQGITGSIGDAIVYANGWGLVKGEAVTVGVGNSFFFPCNNANEWSVRRVDKSATQIYLIAKGHRATVSQRVSDDLLLLSDSMFGSGGTGSKIVAQSGRTGTVLSYGGAGSTDIVGMLKWHIKNGDPYAGRVHIFWHGQNNGTDTNLTKMTAYEMAHLVGAKQKRFVFWSVLGQRVASFSGGRIVVSLQEDARAGTNHLAEIENFYRQAFPAQWFSPRTALLESAVGRNIPDPQFPGMTEEQVAATYGIVPFSYFFDYVGKPFTASNLVFLGYHSAAGLPIGGSDKDYYVRTGNGTVGQLIVNVSGTWTEYIHDFTHMTNAGGDALSLKFISLLTTFNI